MAGANQDEFYSLHPKGPKRILLIDRHDPRRDTREWMLRDAGYEVVTVDRFDLVEGQVQEAAFDLVVISVTDSAAGAKAVTYSQRLRAANADLPILVLSDNGLYLQKKDLSQWCRAATRWSLSRKSERCCWKALTPETNKKLR